MAPLPPPQDVDLRIIGRTFRAAVPGKIVLLAVLTVLAVGLVVFIVVTDEIVERKSIVRREKIDAGEGRTSTGLIKIGAAGESKTHFTDLAFIAAPETARRIAVFAVPFTPQHRKISELITALGHVPRFGDQFHLRDHRILINRRTVGRGRGRLSARKFSGAVE